MDPFSITVGAVGLAAATKKAIGGIKRLKTLRDAPEELQDLLAELSQFEVILQAIENTTYPSECANSALETLLRRAKDKMLEWESLVEYRLTQAGSSSVVDRLRWIGSSKDVDKLREQLREFRANLNVIIGVRTSTTAQNTLELMRQLRLENQRYHHMAAALDSLPQVLTEVQSTNRLLENFPHFTLQTSISSSQARPDDTHNSTVQADRSNTYATSGDWLQLQRTYIAVDCHIDCPCECHKSSFSWIDGPLTRMFGRVRFESRGPSWIRASRHIRSCKASAVSHMQVIYFLPTWFAMKAIYIRYTSSPSHSPEWLLRIPRLIDGDKSRAFKSIRNGDLSEFTSAIANGECTPYDIDERGISVLRFTLDYERRDMLMHLVRMGYDVLRPVVEEDDWLGSLWDIFVGYYYNLSIATTRMLHSSETLPLQDLIPNFPWCEYKKGKRFTLLHEIVCGICGLDLDSAIRTHSADINRLDYKGRSPLEYAVHFQNITAVQTLLGRGADPNVSNGAPVREGFFLESAIDVEMIGLLLRSGATVHDLSGYGIAEAWISQTSNSRGDWGLGVDKLMIEHGMNVNHRHRGRTMLMHLCVSINDEMPRDRIEQLIRYGADLELRNHGGATALLLAVVYKKVMVVKVLIEAGARIDVKTDYGHTLAHFAVIFSNRSDIVKVLFDVDLSRLDLNQTNEYGHTAYDLLKKRNGLRWEKYYKELGKSTVKLSGYHGWWPWPCRAREEEYEIILALEALLHQIQDSQGIPKDQQYPPLGPYLSDDKDEEPVPGAWPV